MDAYGQQQLLLTFRLFRIGMAATKKIQGIQFFDATHVVAA